MCKMRLFIASILLFLTSNIIAQPFKGFLSLDGVNDYAISQDSILWLPGDKTLECFVSFCPKSTSVIDAGILQFKTSNDSLNVMLNVNGSGTLANIKLTDSRGSNAFNIPTFSYNTWNHLAVTFRAQDSAYNIYFNGDSLGSFGSSVIQAKSISVGHRNNPASLYLDDLKFSKQKRYTTSFTNPLTSLAFDTTTKEIFRFEEGQGFTSFAGDSNSALIGYRGAHSIAEIFVTPDSSICMGDSLQLLAKGGTSFIWTPGRILSDSMASNPYFKNDSNTLLSVLVKDSNGCYHTLTTSISVNPLPTPQLGKDTSVCYGTTATLSPGIFNNYLWSNGSIDSIISADEGQYWVRVNDQNNCHNTDSIIVKSLPKLNLNLGNDTVVQFGTTFFIDAGPGFTKYVWSTLEKTQRILTSLPIDYSVKVTDSNGCTASDTISVRFNSVGMVETLGKEQGFRLYPNPLNSKRNLYVSMSSNSTTRIIILDGKAGIVFETELIDSQYIDLSHLESGLYFVQFQSEGHSEYKKLIISTDYPSHQ